jgi:hypothetical protein
MITAGDGRFQFNNVPEGKYSLVARRNGYRTQSLNDHDGFNSAVVVGPGKDSQSLIFRLQPSGSISGRVVDEYGDPVSDGQVSLFRRAAMLGKAMVYPRQRSSLDQNGTYHFFRLPPGEYFVVVIARPWYARFRQSSVYSNGDPPAPQPGEADVDVAFPVTFYPNALDSDSATPIKLRPGERFHADVQVSAQPGFRLLTPLPDNEEPGQFDQHLQASVFGMPTYLDSMVSSMRSNKLAEISGIPAGAYTVRERLRAARPDAPQTRKEVVISAGGDIEYKGETDSTPVAGKVVLDENETLKPMTVEFRRSDTAEGLIVRCNAAGELEPFHLFPGVYEYGAFSSQAVIKSLKATGARVVARTIEIGASPVDVTFEMADIAIEIDGTVQGSDGKPLSGALVVIVPEDPEHNQNIFRRDQSDTDGTFKLRVVMPGRYTLVAIQDGWDLEWSNIEVMRRFLARGRSIQVLPGQENITATLTAQSAQQ